MISGRSASVFTLFLDPLSIPRSIPRNFVITLPSDLRGRFETRLRCKIELFKSDENIQSAVLTIRHVINGRSVQSYLIVKFPDCKFQFLFDRERGNLLSLGLARGFQLIGGEMYVARERKSRRVQRGDRRRARLAKFFRR